MHQCAPLCGGAGQSAGRVEKIADARGATGAGGFRSAHISLSPGSIRVAHEADRCTVCPCLYPQRGASTLLTGRTRCRLRKRVLSRLALAWLGAACVSCVFWIFTTLCYSLNFFSTPLSNTALVATVIELALMAKAPTSSLSRIPKGYSTPAATGMAITL